MKMVNRLNATTVISLTVIDGKTLGPKGRVILDTRILVGVRNPKTNLTHPNVISVPTQRIPQQLFKAILDLVKKTKVNSDFYSRFPEEIFEVELLKSSPFSSRDIKGHNPIIYAVESVLASKLGVSESIQRGEISFVASPVTLLFGSTQYAFLNEEIDLVDDAVQLKKYTSLVKLGKERLRQEYIQMLAIKVVVDNADVFPISTASYSEAKWIKISEFIEMTQKKDVTMLTKYFAEKTIHFCVHGLCVLASFTYLLFLGLIPDSKRLPKQV